MHSFAQAVQCVPKNREMVWRGGAKQEREVWGGGMGWGFAIHVYLALPSSSGRLATTARHVDVAELSLFFLFFQGAPRVVFY